jgi:hypothetical protein
VGVDDGTADRQAARATGLGASCGTCRFAATLCLWLSGVTPAGGREQRNVLLLYPESRLGPAVVAIDADGRTALVISGGLAL